ncbi:MAG: hypothetical protein Q4F85_14995 [Prevotella sp.]|nr:hypothetical protein [Prevotella sp.]
MTENKKRKPYVRPSMEVIKVETTSILAGSPVPETSNAFSNGWVENEAGSEDLDYDN